MARLIPTRGPWEVQCTGPGQTLSILGAPKINGYRRIVAVVSGNDITSEANAALLAAAPKLLKALKDIAAVVEESEGVAGYHLNGNVAKWDELKAFAELDDLIRKAEVREDA